MILYSLNKLYRSKYMEADVIIAYVGLGTLSICAIGLLIGEAGLFDD